MTTLPDDLIAALMFARGRDSALRHLLDRLDPSELEAAADELEAEGSALGSAWLRECAQLAREVAGTDAPAVATARVSHVREVISAPDGQSDEWEAPTVVEGMPRRS
jgi:hypothetical protein